jgi:glycosyltransferase involved in cell wall biosynthesis
MTVNKERIRLTYVLITPARNEEAYIEKAIRSVISQTVLPMKWIIVSDGSTDRTDDIVKKYLSANPWMEFIRMPDERDRSFAAKVLCFNEGYQRIKNLHYDIIANLDADISFDKNYFEFLLNKFREFSDLGVAGTPFVEESGYSTITDSFEGETHVAGGCQLFRRECFDDVGGYIPVKGGGIDWIAVTTARMKGWRTRSYKEKQFLHYRGLGTAKTNVLGSGFAYGKKDYFLGGHPLWEVVRCTYRMTKKPYIVGGLALIAGYLSAWIRRQKRPVSAELMKFHRHEQMDKLKTIIKTLVKFKKISKYHVQSES